MKNLVLISLSLFALAYYGSSASARVPVVAQSNPSIPAWNYVVAIQQPEVGKWGVRETVLAMLVEENIDPVKAERVIFCESSWNPKAVNHNRNGSNDMGLWQINSVHNLPDEVRLSPVKSTEFAIKLIKKKGFQPWVCQ